MIGEVIRNAESEGEIYFLLAAYIESRQWKRALPERLTHLPITGLHDVESRFEQFVAERVTEPLPDIACAEVEEALRVFDAAICRLNMMEREQPKLCIN